MNDESLQYVPCLRWKQGEYQAVMRLSDAVKAQLVPLIEVPELGWDHETRSYKKTIDQHLEPVAKRIAEKWGKARCFLDLKLLPGELAMKDSSHPVTYLFGGLRDYGCDAVPVVQLSSDALFRNAVIDLAAGSGICIRLSIEEASSPTLEDELKRFVKAFQVGIDQCDLVLELGTPNFIPVEGFAKAVGATIARLPELDSWRSFAVLGGSFPTSMAEIKTSPAIIGRNEWLLHKHLVEQSRASGQRLPLFGDYGVSHPAVLEIDMRLVKPSATVRYTSEDCWYVLKGANVRDHGFDQYRNLCKIVVDSSHFCGATFSWGDRYIFECAGGSESTGNLTTWRCVGTNHHLTKVVDDLAILGAVANAA